MTKSKPWFKTKRYGWGWYPSSATGWVVTIAFAVYIAVLGICFTVIADIVRAHDPGKGIYLIVLYIGSVLSSIGAFMYIASKRGDRPNWLWSRKDDR